MLKHQVRSLIFFMSNLFKKREYDILFYYPSHFNRGDNAENSFFSPLYELCDRFGLNYLAIEEPDFGKKTHRNEKAIFFDPILKIILILRKIIPSILFNGFEEKENFIGRLLKIFFFGRFSFDNCIVISNSMLGVLRGIEPKAKLYDYQHGVITSQHSGYLTNDGRVPDHICKNDAHILLYGKGFKKILEIHDTTGYYKTHSHILGKMKKGRKLQKKAPNKNILFTLQITGDGEDSEVQRKWLKHIFHFFETNEKFFITHGFHIYLKQHPRYNGTIDTIFLARFSFIKFTEESFENAISQCSLHITVYSTSIFDAADFGVPTLLWESVDELARLYIDEFDYPIGTCNDFTLLNEIKHLTEETELYERTCQTVRLWYEQIYAPLQEQTFKMLFMNQGSA